MDVSSNKHLIHVGPSNTLDTLASHELVQLGLNLRKCSHKDRALSYVPVSNKLSNLWVFVGDSVGFDSEGELTRESRFDAGSGKP